MILDLYVIIEMNDFLFVEIGDLICVCGEVVELL